MSKELTDRERAIVQQIILDRWNPRRLNKKISSHFGLTINQVRHIRSKATFEAEYKKQLAIYQQSFDDICLADRKERVKAMSELFEKVPDIRVKLKLKILEQIRQEVGHDEPIKHDYEVQIGVNVPPRARRTKSEDGGLTWEELFVYTDSYFRTLDIDVINPDIIYIGAGAKGRDRTRVARRTRHLDERRCRLQQTLSVYGVCHLRCHSFVDHSRPHQVIRVELTYQPRVYITKATQTDGEYNTLPRNARRGRWVQIAFSRRTT